MGIHDNPRAGAGRHGAHGAGILLRLAGKGLLSAGSPVIELENAGWGLEYGAQRCEDFAEIFRQVYDPFDKLRVSWDMNHLLHAIGKSPDGKGACFMLQPFEITSRMQRLEEEFGADPKLFAEKWVEMNILDPSVIRKTGCLHLSDCELKHTEYFRNGRLAGRVRRKNRLFSDKAGEGRVRCIHRTRKV